MKVAVLSFAAFVVFVANVTVAGGVPTLAQVYVSEGSPASAAARTLSAAVVVGAVPRTAVAAVATVGVWFGADVTVTLAVPLTAPALAVTVNGPFRGSWQGVRRILRCQPWGGEGYDPPPGWEEYVAKHPDAAYRGRRSCDIDHSHPPENPDNPL